MNSPNNEIKLFLSNKSKIPVDQLNQSTEMLKSGIIRSITLLELISHLETTFDIQIAEEHLVPENFKDIGALGALVNRVLN
jgi:acyl carrier protein